MTLFEEQGKQARVSGLRSRAQRMTGPAVVIGGLGLATLALRLRDPHQSGSWGLCPSAMLGIWCPGCGGLRAVNDLTHVQVGDAISSNLALVVVLPFVVYLLGRWAVEAWTGRVVGRGLPDNAWFLSATLGALAVFTVLRNLPGFTWLAP
ncbi:DUF2752 domain-containing protein [soil metagenome]